MSLREPIFGLMRRRAPEGRDRVRPECLQVEQLADYSVVIRCVRGSDPHADRTVAEVVEALAAKLGHAVQVRPEFVDEIPHDGGKIRLVRSAVV